MNKRSQWLAVAGVAMVLGLVCAHCLSNWLHEEAAAQQANDQHAQQLVKLAAAANAGQAGNDKQGKDKAAPGVLIAPSKITSVTVYPANAMVTREADVPAGKGLVELTVNPLPAGAIVSSLNAEGLDGLRVLTTRYRARPVVQEHREELAKLAEELAQLAIAREKLEAEVLVIKENTKALSKMESFMGVTVIQATEKGALNANVEAAIKLANYVKEQRLETSRELVKLEQSVKANQAKAALVQRQMNDLAGGTVRSERDAVIVVDRGAKEAAGKVRLTYLVEQASWRPQYKLRAGKSPKDPVQMEFLAAVSQHSGEDWADVKLVLSTAQPMLNASPPDLQTLRVAAVHKSSVPLVSANIAELEEQIKNLRTKAQKDFNEKKPGTSTGLFNTAAALDQAFELHHPDTAIQRGCALAIREGPTVTYQVNTLLAIPSRAEEQVVEVARAELAADFYYKAVPLITTQVYRLADFVNKTEGVILPGDATMYIGSDFVGQMPMPLVAVNEPFTVGFGVDPQLQATRQLVSKSQTTQGGNQTLKFKYRTTITNFKNEKVKMQVWDRLPRSDTDAITINILESTPEISKDAAYLRGPRTQNLLRWDVTVEPNAVGEKALFIQYEFKMELDKNMTIGDPQTIGVLSQPGVDLALAPLTPAEQAKIAAAMAKLSPADQALAQAQMFCAVDTDSRLGSMGPIQKVMLKGQPVFLCCKGCEAEARAHPDETLQRVQALMTRLKKKP
jgi:uncharacterized protein (TIGR02231 family)